MGGSFEEPKKLPKLGQKCTAFYNALLPVLELPVLEPTLTTENLHQSVEAFTRPISLGHEPRYSFLLTLK
jgi:hypothetical protein